MPKSRYLACKMCAKAHPTDASTPLAVLVSPRDGGPPLLHRAIRGAGIRFSDKSGRRGPRGTCRDYDEAPLARHASDGTMLDCARCGRKFGPVSARDTRAWYAAGKGDDGIVFFPLATPGEVLPRPIRGAKHRPLG